LDSSADSIVHPARHYFPCPKPNYLNKFALETTMTANRFHSLIATSLFCVLSSGLAALPAAADDFEPLKVTVKFGDLDVSHEPGAAVLYLRIRAAARNVCSPYEGSGFPAKILLEACVDKAVADAVAKVGNPALFAVYSAKMGKAMPARLASLQHR
jgi:UrcA family protein